MGDNNTAPVFFQETGWRDELKKLIKEVVSEELKTYKHTCRLDFGDSEVREVNHALGMIEDLGKGRVAAGIELIRDNHKWLAQQRLRGDRLSTAFFCIIATAVLGGMCTALWIGLKHMIGAKLGG